MLFLVNYCRGGNDKAPYDHFQGMGALTTEDKPSDIISLMLRHLPPSQNDRMKLLSSFVNTNQGSSSNLPIFVIFHRHKINIFDLE